MHLRLQTYVYKHPLFDFRMLCTFVYMNATGMDKSKLRVCCGMHEMSWNKSRESFLPGNCYAYGDGIYKLGYWETKNKIPNIRLGIKNNYFVHNPNYLSFSKSFWSKIKRSYSSFISTILSPNIFFELVIIIVLLEWILFEQTFIFEVSICTYTIVEVSVSIPFFLYSIFLL